MSVTLEKAAALYAALRDGVPIPPLTADHPDMKAAEAYAIQQEFTRLLLAEGGEILGYKLGLTSTAMQEMLGVSEPDYGPIVSRMTFSDGASFALEQYIQPRVEAEIALFLRTELRGPGVTVADAALAVGGAAAAIEVVDSRIVDWQIGLADTIADLASTAATIISDRVVAIDEWEPKLLGMIVSRNDVEIDHGVGANAMGDPLEALAWLANTIAFHGEKLEAGWFVLTGALHRAFQVEPGDVIRADFDHLGSVTCRFT